jgi:hypothetical protein
MGVLIDRMHRINETEVILHILQSCHTNDGILSRLRKYLFEKSLLGRSFTQGTVAIDVRY